MERGVENKLFELNFYQKFCDEIKDLFSKGALLEKQGPQGLAVYRRHFFSDNFTNKLTGESSNIKGEALMLQVFSFQGIHYYYSDGRFRFWLTNDAKTSVEWLKGAPANNQTRQKRAWSEPIEPSNLIVLDPKSIKGIFSWKHSINLRGSSEVFVAFSNGYLIFSKTLLLQGAANDGETLLVRNDAKNVFIYWYESASFQERFSGRIPLEHLFFNHMGIDFEFRSETFLQWYQDYIKKGKLFSDYMLYKANVNFTGGSPEFRNLLEDITANLVSLNILDARAFFFGAKLIREKVLDLLWR